MPVAGVAGVPPSATGRAGPARLAGRTIVCLSSIDWDFLWQVHQQIMAALAAAGSHVLFVESTGVRAPGLSDLPRLWRRLRGGGRGHGPRRRPDNVTVYSPVVLPFPYLPAARAVNRPVLERAIRRGLGPRRDDPRIIWNFLPTPLSRELVARLDPALSIFHCVDHLSASSAAAARLAESEARCFADADLVFVSSHRLAERARRHNPHVYLVPAGVDLDRFEGAGDTPVPDDLARLPRPVVGYLGGVHQWLDEPLLAAVAEGHPEWSVVLVGPRQTAVPRLAALPNVHLLGTRGPDAVPGYLRGFDVGLVPYRLADYTHHVYPVKLNEYLVMGLPVVSTPLDEITRFNAEHGGLVSVAGTPDAFASAIAAALANDDPGAAAARRAVARRNSWAARIDRMAGVVADALEARGVN